MTKVESVARAIASDEHDWNNAIVRELLIKRACAAIEAMREPTDEMLKAGTSAAVSYDQRFEGPEDISEQIWDGMIDAALNERP